MTASPEETFGAANIILCTYPAFLCKSFIMDYESYISQNTKLGFIPGYGG